MSRVVWDFYMRNSAQWDFHFSNISPLSLARHSALLWMQDFNSLKIQSPELASFAIFKMSETIVEYCTSRLPIPLTPANDLLDFLTWPHSSSNICTSYIWCMNTSTETLCCNRYKIIFHMTLRMFIPLLNSFRLLFILQYFQYVWNWGKTSVKSLVICQFLEYLFTKWSCHNCLKVLHTFALSMLQCTKRSPHGNII